MYRKCTLELFDKDNFMKSRVLRQEMCNTFSILHMCDYSVESAQANLQRGNNIKPAPSMQPGEVVEIQIGVRPRGRGGFSTVYS